MDRATYLRELHSRFGVPSATVATLVEGATDRTVTATHRLVRGDECEIHRVCLDDGSATYLRISFPGTPSRKLYDEAWVMARAREAGVPVPEVIAVESIESDAGQRTAMVVREASGRQLLNVLASLSSEQRSRVMVDVGGVLKRLHSIPMPGGGRPDEHGVWNDPETDRRRYLRDVLVDCRHLSAAGFTPPEVRQVVEVMESATGASEVDVPVLCHGDVSPEHVFVDSELQVVGLIDWGMWGAGPAVSELAGLAMRNTEEDFAAILTGHGDAPTGPALRYSLAWHTSAHAIGQIRWLVTSGQLQELGPHVNALREAFTELAE